MARWGHDRLCEKPGVEAGSRCLPALYALLQDEDATVRGSTSGVFHALRADHIIPMRDFIQAYAASPALYSGTHQFLTYLSEHGLLDPAWTLSVIETVVQNQHQPEEAWWSRSGAELTRLVLRIYTDPTGDGALRVRAMDVFDQLLKRYAGEAQVVLGEWDTR